MKKITILGTGAYGIALSLMFHENNCTITMWTKFEEEKNMLIKKHAHEKVLPSIQIPSDISFTTDLRAAVKDSDLIVLAIPAQFIRETCMELSNYFTPNQHILIASKGIEKKSGKFMNEVVEDYIRTDHMAVIAGPTFAIDLASYIPAGLTLASSCSETSNFIKKTLQNQYLKLEENDDILGVEICSSIKNIMAIACGIIHGMGYPISTQCLFIIEALYSIENLITSLGGDQSTIVSLAGIGDLILTCMSEKSRNFTLGKFIGEEKEQNIIEEYKKNTTIEGLYTMDAIYDLMKKKNIVIPLIEKIYNIINNNEKKETLLSFVNKTI